MCNPVLKDKEFSYLEVNRAAYDILSEEYALRAGEYKTRDIFLIAPLLLYLRKRFGARPIRMLDIGPGSGLNLQLCHEEGCEIVGVDLSPKVVAKLRLALPYAQLILGDFVTTDIQGRFHGIISKASLHLFPKSDGLKYIQKMGALLEPGGMAYISVAHADAPSEGFSVKSDYPGQVLRFKKAWTRSELLRSLAEFDLTVEFDYLEDEGGRGKRWLNVYSRKGGAGNGF